jgi:hypothetical protein
MNNKIKKKRKLKLDPCLSPCTSFNSRWMKDFNIKTETWKLVQERTGNTLDAICIDMDFLRRTQVAQQLKRKDG